ncbi:YidC/Oxa1 family membrane protein insertase [Candidatus Peregrinibacteria bacterium]|nr:YidC/Oxa1 family membrane protein insertase [Candidatus Peregrinibacteria bacterium]
MDKKALKNLLNQALTFLVIFLIVNFVYNQFFNKAEAPQTGVQFYTSSKTFAQNDVVVFHVDNFTEQAITIKNLCPQAPVKVEKLVNGQWESVEYAAPLKCEGLQDTIIQPKEKHQIKLQSWSHQLFSELGNYRLKLTLGDQTLESNQFEIGNMSFFGWLWTTVIHQPIYNALIFFASIAPGHNLGLAIILLTILIRTILLIPNQKALKSQKKLQSVQHKISSLKDKHGDDQQKIAQETFAIYKEHKVSPFGSCLPILIQLPILIGLFNVIQNGMDPGSSWLLYPPLKSFDLTLIETNFYGLWDLTKIDFITLPVLVGLLQFLQVKLSMGRKKPAAGKSSEMETASRTMMFIMPVMIAFFTASVPSGVGLYWAFSTTYGIIQQLIVNKQHEQVETSIKVVDDKSNKEKKEYYKQLNEERKNSKSENQDSDQNNQPDSDKDDQDKDNSIRVIKA